MNRVLAGDFLNANIEFIQSKKEANICYIKLQGGKRIYLTDKNIVSYELIDFDRDKNLKGAAVGYALAGAVGGIIGLGAKNGAGIKIKIYFKNGQSCLIGLSNVWYDFFMRGVYNVKKGPADAEQIDKNYNIITNSTRKYNPLIIIFILPLFVGLIVAITQTEENTNMTINSKEDIKQKVMDIGIYEIDEIKYYNDYDNLEGPGTKGYVVYYDRHYDYEYNRYIKKHVVVYIDEKNNVFYITDGIKDYYRNGQILEYVSYDN